MAARVFWVIYVLDRRWSFGTSLSFALVDRDIDPELPEPVSYPTQSPPSTYSLR
jgi:regulator of sirC expression with transglutaminase-like and TPR domain